MVRSEQELDAVHIAVTPNDLAWLALLMSRHEHQSKRVPDIHRGGCDDFGAARRDVQDKAFAACDSIVERNPGQLFVRLPPRFALDLFPWLINRHGWPSGVGFE
jgi:hypothetical protein